MKMKKQAGQALITLIFFTVIATTITTAAVSVLFTNTLSTATAEVGLKAYYAAESGAEEGFLRLLRHPAYGSTETFNQTFEVGEGQAKVTIENGNIISVGSILNGSVVRKVEVQTQLNNGAFTVTSWKEID
ncbi:hypothetical protein A3B45_00990 [Candidatus Daviesbacteria bacterium RIFCSPLOWO2_01_FULL_39_12]|uniref:Type 4 fimbrial biogenesis protein PilX N-terminal domain-containing protein n=1 Tax=Candidatus Daviesbacteria bacterium RIFCSPLOWO2_01_FULL_39_12 TaxID=1797785 RepID=A0A1F5KU52_9BACT|nr:MAG: hypothetical protein A3D79_02075 [Candidatus Daviesbacteria bacterium RIFCSPHIGHO2_02_FULL_39_8]OGE44151.1 MAG: hypothetical protein A3B45_00990 [Candidatus Daviesbacteria bacterium RIFCSPLOWO2_01_FULL_39_12]